MTSTFPSQEIQLFLDSFCHETRQKYREIASDPIFTPRFDVSIREQKEIALQRLQLLSKNKLFSVEDFEKNPQNVFANHECAAWLDGSLATKLTVQYNLFGGTVLTLGTERHRKIAQGVNDLSVIGCFALTELGFGNNAVQMETTAHYDQKSQEFIINSPTVLSQKYWITNGAYHCNYAVVFAQLIMPENKNEGVHAFLVRVRNDKKEIEKGVFIEDMGHKFGLNGVDNGRLKFTNVRIPREALLNRYSEVDANNQFTSKIQQKRMRFLKVADRLLSGRICIASMMLSGTKLCMNIAVRYGNKRMAMGQSGMSDTSIMNLGLFQNVVYPLLARTLTLNSAFNQVKDIYSTSLLKKQEADPYLISLCCVIKPLITWNGRDVGTTLVERIGGQGYLSVNRVSELLPFSHSGITAEGDNSVLMQKVAKELSMLIQQGKYTIPKPKLNKQEISKKSVLDINDLHDLLIIREQESLNQLLSITQEKMQANKTLYDVWMVEENMLVQQYSRGFGERIVSEFSFNQISKLNGKSQEIMALYRKLHLVSVIILNLGWYLQEGIVSKEAAKQLGQEQQKLIFDIHPIALQTVNSFGVPEAMLCAPIAQDYEKYNSRQNNGEIVPKL